jgi:hypothetical protein
MLEHDPEKLKTNFWQIMLKQKSRTLIRFNLGRQNPDVGDAMSPMGRAQSAR